MEPRLLFSNGWSSLSGDAAINKGLTGNTSYTAANTAMAYPGGWVAAPDWATAVSQNVTGHATTHPFPSDNRFKVGLASVIGDGTSEGSLSAPNRKSSAGARFAARRPSR